MSLSPLKIMGMSASILIANLLAASGVVSAPYFYGMYLSSQQPLAEKPSPLSTFSVGISLQSSYGAIAILSSDGATTTFKIDGDDSYREVMARLSLESSRHLAPPYSQPSDAVSDIPRVTKRNARKKMGLPASSDVGVLSKLIESLCQKAQMDLRIEIDSAVITVSHLVALYQDDIQDAFEFVGLRYVEPKKNYRPLVWETASAYAGYGFGLCEHYSDAGKCAAEEDDMKDQTAFSVHYSKNALSTSLAVIRIAIDLWEPDYRHAENFTLGHDEVLKDGKYYGEDKEYWTALKEHLRLLLVRNSSYQRPARAIVTGDMADDKTFIVTLEEVLRDNLEKVPPLSIDDPVFVAARGAAEFRKRADF